MPTVLKIEGYRFFFFSDEHLPLHVHVEKGEAYMRVELETFKITHRYKVSKSDERKIVALTKEYQQKLIGAWHEYFDYSR